MFDTAVGDPMGGSADDQGAFSRINVGAFIDQAYYVAPTPAASEAATWCRSEKAGTAGRAASVIAVDAAISCRPGGCATWCDVPSASGAARSSEATPSFGAASCSVSVGAAPKPLSVVGTHNHESTS